MPKRCVLDLAPQRSPRASGGRKIAFDAGTYRRRVSEGGDAAAGCRTCGAQPPWPSAIGSASGRTGECVPTIGASTFTLAAAGGADDFPCKSARPSLGTLRALGRVRIDESPVDRPVQDLPQ